MTVILVLLGTISGALIGGCVGFFGVILLGTLMGADTQQGALAMGAASGGLPLGLIVGGILGGVLALRARLKSPVRSESSAPTGSVLVPEAPGPRRVWGIQDAIALLLVAALAIGAWTWFNDTGDPPLLRGSSKPVLHAEIKIPASDPGIAFALNRGSDLRNGQVYHGAAGRMGLREEEGHMILTAIHPIAYKTEDRSVELWLGENRLLVFRLDLPRKPPESPEFSAWRPVDEIRPDAYGSLIPDPPGGNKIFIRTKVLWSQF